MIAITIILKIEINRGFIFWLIFWWYSPSLGKGMATGAWGSSSRCIYSQEAERWKVVLRLIASFVLSVKTQCYPYLGEIVPPQLTSSKTSPTNIPRCLFSWWFWISSSWHSRLYHIPSYFMPIYYYYDVSMS